MDSEWFSVGGESPGTLVSVVNKQSEPSPEIQTSITAPQKEHVIQINDPLEFIYRDKLSKKILSRAKNNEGILLYIDNRLIGIVEGSECLELAINYYLDILANKDILNMGLLKPTFDYRRYKNHLNVIAIYAYGLIESVIHTISWNKLNRFKVTDDSANIVVRPFTTFPL